MEKKRPTEESRVEVGLNHSADVLDKIRRMNLNLPDLEPREMAPDAGTRAEAARNQSVETSSLISRMDLPDLEPREMAHARAEVGLNQSPEITNKIGQSGVHVLAEDKE